MKLSTRLHLMADQITEGESIADIGTDHGLLPIYLLHKRVSDKVIFVDLSEKALQKAVRNYGLWLQNDPVEFQELINLAYSLNGNLSLRNDSVNFRYLPSQYAREVDFRVGDGLSVLEEGEVDAVFIAGLGGNTIVEILAEDLTKTKSINKYVLQPRNRTFFLRKWLFDNNFQISNELLVRENKYICDIIVATSRDDALSFAGLFQNNNCKSLSFPDKISSGYVLSLKNEGESITSDHFDLEEEMDLQFEISSAIYSCDRMLSLEYLEHKKKVSLKILNGLVNSGTPDDKRISLIKKMIGLIESLEASL